MHILVAGAHGQVGQHIISLLSKGYHQIRPMIRREEQSAQLAAGAETVVADLTEDVSHALKGCDALIFAAGSSGKDVRGVDRDGAIKLLEAAEQQGVERYVMLSSMGAGEPERGPEALRPYLKAEGEADERLQASTLNYTIVRPGRLIDDAATGKIKAAARFDEWGEITREDVAKALVLTLELTHTYGQTFELSGGDTPTEEALKAL